MADFYSKFCCRLDLLKDTVGSRNIKFIVVDSIASLVRKEFDVRKSEGISKRSALLSKQASILKQVKVMFILFVSTRNL